MPASFASMDRESENDYRGNPYDSTRLKTALDTMNIELRPIGSIKSAHRNARTHSEQRIGQIAASSETFGFISPIVIDADSRIVAGHGRYRAARQLGREYIAVIEMSHLTPAQVRASALADNKIAQNSGWGPEILRSDFAELAALDLGLELEITGFSTTEIDLLSKLATAEAKLEQLPALKKRDTSGVEPVDLWQLGRHRLFCDDAREEASFVPVWPSSSAQRH